MAIHDLFKTCNFRIQLKNTKKIELVVQQANIPGFSIGQIDLGRPNVFDKRPGDKLEFNDLMLQVVMDEDLNVLKELYDALILSSNPDTGRLEVKENIFEGTMFLLTNKNNLNHQINFHNCFLRSFDDIQLTHDSSEDEQVTVSITISFTHYSFA